MTLRNDKSDRQQRAILAVMRGHVGPPLTVREVIRQAAAMGIDAPTIKPTLHKMTKKGLLAVRPTSGTGSSRRFTDLLVTLRP